jgi:hypothetical protein
MHFLFNLVRINGLYMFRALAQHSNPSAANWHNTHAILPSAVCVAPPEDEQVMFETYNVPYFLINWIKSESRWFH